MISKAETDLLDTYADAVNIDRELNRKVYLKGSPSQRSIDQVAMRATLYFQKKRDSGELKVGKKGKIKSKKKMNALVEEFLEQEKDLPEFFQEPSQTSEVSASN